MAPHRIHTKIVWKDQNGITLESLPGTYVSQSAWLNANLFGHRLAVNDPGQPWRTPYPIIAIGSERACLMPTKLADIRQRYNFARVNACKIRVEVSSGSSANLGIVSGTCALWMGTRLAESPYQYILNADTYGQTAKAGLRLDLGQVLQSCRQPQTKVRVYKGEPQVAGSNKRFVMQMFKRFKNLDPDFDRDIRYSTTVKTQPANLMHCDFIFARNDITSTSTAILQFYVTVTQYVTFWEYNPVPYQFNFLRQLDSITIAGATEDVTIAAEDVDNVAEDAKRVHRGPTDDTPGVTGGGVVTGTVVDLAEEEVGIDRHDIG